MEALRSTLGHESRDKHDSILPSLAAPVWYLRAIMRRPLPSQTASPEMPDRFELLLRVLIL
jgi:hypothetical protein